MPEDLSIVAIAEPGQLLLSLEIAFKHELTAIYKLATLTSEG
jgi:hypothetical protein